MLYDSALFVYIECFIIDKRMPAYKIYSFALFNIFKYSIWVNI